METTSAENSPRPSILIERAKPSDADAIYDLQSLTWLDTYPNKKLGVTVADIRELRAMDNTEEKARKVARWKANIEQQDDTKAVFVARLDGKVVGFNAPRVMEDGRGRPAALYLLPQYQGLGIGAKLFQNSLEFLGDRDLFLHVASYNTKAIEFYKKFGFVESGPIDDVVMFPSGSVIPEIEMIKPAST